MIALLAIGFLGGLVTGFSPCIVPVLPVIVAGGAGPVLAAISVVAATHRVGITSVLLTISYAAGTAVRLLVLALVARRTATGWTKLRTRTPLIRKFAGAVLGLSALAIALNLIRPLRTSVPGFTSALENHIEGTAAATKRLQALTGEHANRFAQNASDAAASLPDLGPAPAFSGITTWLNTPGNEPLTLGNLRGKVVLVDFWTYSCINCQRTLPHIEAWYRTYSTYGFVVVGVHPKWAARARPLVRGGGLRLHLRVTRRSWARTSSSSERRAMSSPRLRGARFSFCCGSSHALDFLFEWKVHSEPTAPGWCTSAVAFLSS